jgi:hypothetical protein
MARSFASWLRARSRIWRSARIEAKQQYGVWELILERVDHRIAEAKAKHRRAEEAWIGNWRNYQDIRTYLAQADHARGQQIDYGLFAYFPADLDITQKREELARYEADPAELHRLEQRNQASDDSRRDRQGDNDG